MMRITTGRSWLVLLSLAAAGIAAADRDVRLVDAARNADWAALPALLKQGAPVTAAHADRSTALHWAVYWADAGSTDLLIQAGANVNAANDLGATPLWVACENAGTALVQRLLQAGANPNVALLSGETPLMTAARTGNVDVVKLLIARGADVNAKEHEFDQTAVMWAVAEKHPVVVDVLLAHGTNVHTRAKAWTQTVKVTPEQGSKNVVDIQQGGYTPLLFAARVGDLESARLLLAAGANVNDTAPYGTSATVVAAHSGHTELAIFLLGKGADPNAAGAGYSALHAAIVRGDEKLVGALLAAGANPNAKLAAPTPSRRQSGDIYLAPAFVGATPFWIAARYSAANIMRLLLKYGADPTFVHYPDYWSQGGGYEDIHVAEGPTTALMAAAGMGHRLFRWDGDLPPDPIEEEAKTYTAVEIAAGPGIDVNAQNADGNTALHMAMSRGFDRVAKLLIEKGARPDIKNKRGQTPAEAAKAGSRRGYQP